MQVSLLQNIPCGDAKRPQKNGLKASQYRVLTHLLRKQISIRVHWCLQDMIEEKLLHKSIRWNPNTAVQIISSSFKLPILAFSRSLLKKRYKGV